MARKLLFTVLLAASLRAQEDDRIISPGRGLQPAHTYALSDIEAIDRATGALSLHIPITSLPPGPGGFTAGVSLVYNSKYWETEPVMGLTQMTYGLRGSKRGGWRMALTHTVEAEFLTSRESDPCGGGGLPNTIFQMQVHDPDGAAHLLIARDQSMPAACEAGTYPVSDFANRTSPSSWYAADGSFYRLELSQPSPPLWAPGSVGWTLYMKDGSSVAFDAATRVTAIRDRNGNQITVQGGIDGAVPWEEMSDSFGRKIRVDHYVGDRDVVTQTGHDGNSQQPLIWTARFVGFPTMPAATDNYRCVNGVSLENCTFGAVPALLWTLELPHGLAYTFNYQGRYGELTGVTLPTGAQVNYTYRLDPVNSPVYYYNILANTIASKTILHQNAPSDGPWAYNYIFNPNFSASGTSEFTSPDGGLTKHEFTTVGYQFGLLPGAGTITRITQPDGSILDRVWAYNAPFQLPTQVAYPNPWVKTEYLSRAGTGLPGTPVATSVKVMTSDKNGNITSVEERGWVAYNAASLPPPASAPLLRKEARTYVNQSADSSLAIADNAYSHSTTATPKNLLASVEVSTSGNAVVSRSQLSYEEPGFGLRGNLVSEFHWDSALPGAGSIAPGTELTAGNAVGRRYAYSNRGNRTEERNERDKVVSYTYGAITCPGGTVTDLYPTQMQRGGSGSVPQTWTYQHNCYSGLRTLTTDPNASEVNVQYDRYSRPAMIREGPAGNYLRKTVHLHDDVNRWVSTESDVENAEDQRSVSIQHFDDLGRVRLQRQLEATVPAQTAAANETLGVKVETRYFMNATGNDVLVSNPYRANEQDDTGRGWRARRLDKAGRLCAEETFSGGALPALAPNCGSSGGDSRTQYTYDGTLNWARQTVADPAGAVRELYSDALGRLVAVVEDPSSLRYHTYYGYDTRDNLESVRQAGTCANDPVTSRCAGGVARNFTYSSLNRLLTAYNPESGQVQYAYDKAGNLIRRTSPGVVRWAGNWAGQNYSDDGYDDLNRPLSQFYNDGTPAVAYAWDVANATERPGACGMFNGAVGRLSSVSNGVSATYYYYNRLGQAQCSRQKTGSAPYDFLYTPTPAGEWKQVVYPSGRVVTATFDDAGRPTGVGTPGGGNYADTVQYAAHGGAKQVRLGNGLWETYGYNGRLQVTDIKLGMAVNGSEKWWLRNTYPGAGNNGNVAEQWEAALGWTASTVYRYDKSNRLTLAVENPANAANVVCPDAGSGWCEQYGYDERGNRLVTASYPGQSLGQPAGYGTDNRIVGWLYDTAGRGNLRKNSLEQTFEYDGEDRQVRACTQDGASGTCPEGTAAGRTQYGYDGEGRRVTRSGAAGNMVWVYDAKGRLAAEYGTATGVAGRQYLTGDHLGSTRVVTDGNGAVKQRRDYFPFGGEIPASAAFGNRQWVTDGQPGTTYNATGGPTQEFTGKERDAETGLDYFGARYFSGAQGRFTSPDPMLNSAKPWDPQSWNRYCYALNNPLKFVDPNGLYNLVNTCAEDDKKCNKQFEQNAANLKQGVTDLQKRVDKMKNGAEKDRLQAALGAMGTENDKNNVNVQFGPTGDGAAAQTNPFYNEQTGKMGFNVIFNPKHITGGTNDWAIDAAHEGTHVADISDPRYANQATTLSPFSVEYRGYTTSAWAASALGLPSLSYGRYQIWNPSWGLVDKTLTNYITSMKDAQGRQDHPETIPHNPWGN